MRRILREDIVGARIVDIHQTYELLEGGCDCRVIYFTVDRGFTFETPSAGVLWTAVDLPAGAQRLEDEVVIEDFAVKRGWLGRMRFVRQPSTKDETVKQIKQRVIAGVYCGPFVESLGFHYPDDGTLVFDDGSQASNTRVAPHGTGSAGLYYFGKGSEKCAAMDQLTDYFTIPVEDDNHA